MLPELEKLVLAKIYTLIGEYSMKKHLLSKMTATCVLGAVAVVAAADSAKGNWTETFQLTGGHYVVHTPNYTSLDGMITSGKGLHMQTRSFNGMPISDCGLHLETDSTREEFVSALRCAGF